MDLAYASDSMRLTFADFWKAQHYITPVGNLLGEFMAQDQNLED